MTLPKIGAKAEIDFSDWSRDVDKMVAKVDDLPDTIDMKAAVSLDDNALKNVEKRLAGLDSQTATPDVKVNDANALTVLGNIESKLSALNDKASIELALKVPDLAQGAFESITNAPVISRLVSIDDAMSLIQARTGKMIPEAEHLISDLWVNGWGESPQQIGEVISQASKLGIAGTGLSEAVTKAFEVQAATGSETNEILRAMDSLVKNGLTKSYSEAADVIVTGFQTGSDRGEDLLDTFNEYGSTFQQLRISGEGALGFINSGLKAGVDNSDRIADALREAGIRLREMNINPEFQAAFRELDAMSNVDLAGLFDAYEAGVISGDAFFQGYFQAFEDADAIDPAKTANLFTTLVATISEDFGPSVLAKLTPQWDDAMGQLEGRAAKAGTAASDNIGTAWTELTRTVETRFVDAIDNAFDIQGKIDDAKRRVFAFADALQGGATMGGALEVALEIPGFEETFNRFEAAIGNIFLDLMGTLAKLLDLIGQGDAANTLRGRISEGAAMQLSFDVQAAGNDMPAITAAAQRAIERGVGAADINTALGTALDEMLASGDFAGATALATNLEESLNAELNKSFAGLSSRARENLEFLGVDIATATREQVIQGLIQANNDVGGLEGDIALVSLPMQIDTAGMREKVAAYVADLNTQFVEAIQAGDFDLATTLSDQLGGVEVFADELVMKLDAGLFAAMEAGNVQQTRDIGEMLGLPENKIEDYVGTAQTQFDRLQTGATEAGVTVELVGATMSAEVQDTERIVGASADNMGESFTGLGDVVALVKDNVSESWGILIDRIIAKASEAIQIVTTLGDTVNALADSGGGGGGTGSAPSGSGPSFAAGSGARGNVSGLQAMLGGGGPMTSFNNQRSIVVNQTNIMQSGAQAENIGVTTNRLVRGF